MKKINIKTALLISIFWWYLWLDRFYQWDNILWLIKLFTFWWYWIWWIIDIYILLKKQDKKDIINWSKALKDVINWTEVLLNKKENIIIIFKKIIKIIMYGFWLIVIFWIIVWLLNPPSSIEINTIPKIENWITLIDNIKINWTYKNIDILKINWNDVILNNNWFTYDLELKLWNNKITIIWDWKILFSDNIKKVTEKELEEMKNKEYLKKLDLQVKRDIYYIYWQSEHIAWLKTIEKFWNSWNQNKRDNFFKNTKIEYEEQLTQEKWIDYKLYKKYALELWYWEWEDNNWFKPNSESEDVIKYAYSEEKYNQYLKEKEEKLKKIQIEEALEELKSSDSLWMSCQMYISWDGFLSRFNHARIEQLSDNKVNVYTTFNWKNVFWQKVKQAVICKYKYDEEYKKFSIIDVEL